MIATSRLTGQELDIYMLTTGRLKCAWFLVGQNEGAMLVALRLTSDFHALVNVF